MTVNILLCDTFPGLLPEYIPSYEWMFMRLFDSVGEGLEYKVFRTMEGELPDIGGVSGLCLITGCNKAAYDGDGWIKSLLEWIVRASEAGVKLVGVCFGHQAIAQALGGRVERAAQGWGTGVRESRVVDGRALGYFPDGRMRLLYNHHDQVVSLPRGAELVAASGFCPIESFRVGGHILTFQGHPEYLPEYAVHLLTDCADGEPLQVRQDALRSIGAMRHEGEAAARMILDFAQG